MRFSGLLLTLFMAPLGSGWADISDSGGLTIGGQGIVVGTMTVSGNAFSVGGSTLAASSGRVGVRTASPGEALEVNGGIKIGSALGTADGTIRWTGSDFEGRKQGQWVSLAVATSCPAGFVLVSSAGVTLGCIQNAEEGSGTWANANDDCFDTYGGRLPTISESCIAMRNLSLTDETDDFEWVDGGDTGQSALIHNPASSICSMGASGQVNSIDYRCWLPR